MAMPMTSMMSSQTMMVLTKRLDTRYDMTLMTLISYAAPTSNTEERQILTGHETLMLMTLLVLMTLWMLMTLLTLLTLLVLTLALMRIIPYEALTLELETPLKAECRETGETMRKKDKTNEGEITDTDK